nr:MAG TPA: hypothetical protein [Caudoviricetes sp.]
MNYLELLSKVEGAIFGVAIGDALGATNEFKTKEQIERVGKVTEIIGGGWLNLEPGEITDDTQMTLCVSEAMHLAYKFKHSERKKTFLDTCGYNFLKWYESNPKDVGICCSNVIGKFVRDKRRNFENWLNWAKNINNKRASLGNGGLMRCVPCCFIKDKSWAILQSEMTHNNEVSSRCVSIYYDAFRICLFAETRIQASLEIQKLIVENKDLFEKYLDSEYSFSGHVVNSLYHALDATVRHDTFEDAILYIVNNGGDSDTIGAIAGGLIGCLVGYKNLPCKFVNGLQRDVRSKLYLAARNITDDVANEYR